MDPRLKAVLKEHFLCEVVCDHEAKTDRPVCSCSLWRGPECENVGKAVEAWIKHVEDVYGADSEPEWQPTHVFTENGTEYQCLGESDYKEKRGEPWRRIVAYRNKEGRVLFTSIERWEERFELILPKPFLPNGTVA